MSPEAKIHVHVWSDDSTEILEEVDLPMTGVYDDHYQFSGTVQGKHLEIRIPKQ